MNSTCLTSQQVCEHCFAILIWVSVWGRMCVCVCDFCSLKQIKNDLDVAFAMTDQALTLDLKSGE